VEYIDGSPYVDEIVTQPWRLDDEGLLVIPDSPGLGIQIDPDALARFADSDLVIEL
jgi:L-alanine-DL-glutamate epimerase-like enolase superfamily enzyme